MLKKGIFPTLDFKEFKNLNAEKNVKTPQVGQICSKRTVPFFPFSVMFDWDRMENGANPQTGSHTKYIWQINKNVHVPKMQHNTYIFV